MADDRFAQERRIDRPVAGFYKRRLRSKGPWVPAIIYSAPPRDPHTLASMERPAALVCIVDGEERDVEREWPGLHPISREVYERLCREREGVEDLPINQSKVRI